MKKIVLSLILCVLFLSAAQAQIDFSVTPKGVTKGFSVKGLSAEAIAGLGFCRFDLMNVVKANRVSPL